MFPSSIYIHVNILSPLILFWAPRVRPLTKANNDLDGQIQLSVSVALVAHPAAFDMMILSWTLAAYLPSALCFLDRSHELEVYRANSVSPLPPICSPPACLSIVSKCQFHTSGGFDRSDSSRTSELEGGLRAASLLLWVMKMAVCLWGTYRDPYGAGRQLYGESREFPMAVPGWSSGVD